MTLIPLKCRRQGIIDIDKAWIFLETAHRAAGKAYVGARVSSGGL